MGIKRSFDIICALCGLIILSPVLLLIIVLIKLTSTGPVFFRQTRVGQYEKLFQIHKFRTMIVNAEASGLKITVGRDPRITSIGHFLRKTKLDELPQLFNILNGEMTLVGPRPDVAGYADVLDASDRVLLELLPGITGLASLKYRNEEQLLARQSHPQTYNDTVIWPDKVRINKWYALNRSFFMDVMIVFYTLFPFHFDVDAFIEHKSKK